jgi:hypothetical protein
MQGDPEWRQSRKRVPELSAPGRYPAGVPRHQSAGALGEYPQPSGLADTRITGRPHPCGLTARVGECRPASRAIPGFAGGQRLIESPVLAAAVPRCGYKTAEPGFAGRRVERRTPCRQSEGGSCKEGPGRHQVPNTQPSAPTRAAGTPGACRNNPLGGVPPTPTAWARLKADAAARKRTSWPRPGATPERVRPSAGQGCRAFWPGMAFRTAWRSGSARA